MDGGGEKKGMDGKVVGILMFGIEGNVVGMVGSDAGKGGNVTFGIVGKVGIVGSVVGNGTGTAGNGGSVTFGRPGMVGSVGAEVCSKLRAAKLTCMLESDNATTKNRAKQCLIAAIVW